MARPAHAYIAGALVENAPKSTDIDWHARAGYLSSALVPNKKHLPSQGKGAEELSEPNLAQWTAKGGEFRRNKKKGTT